MLASQNTIQIMSTLHLVNYIPGQVAPENPSGHTHKFVATQKPLPHPLAQTETQMVQISAACFMIMHSLQKYTTDMPV